MKNKFKPISNTEEGLLTRLFRSVIFETGFVHTLEDRIKDYIRKGGARKKASIEKEILEGRISWKSFIFLLYEILPLYDVSLTLTTNRKSFIDKNKTITETYNIDIVRSNKEEDNEQARKRNKRSTKDS